MINNTLKNINFNVSKITKNSNNIFMNQNKDIKIINNSKYYIPANKEWINSVYSFDKSFIKFIPAKYKILNKLLISYFGTIPFYKIKHSSLVKRTRILRKQNRILRKSLNRILLSNAEIKYTNDKIILNVYTLNKEKEPITTKIFYLNNSLRFNKMLKSFLNTKYFKSLVNNRDIYNVYSNTNVNNNVGSLNIKKLYKVKYKTYLTNTVLYKKKLAIYFAKNKFLFKNIFFFSFLKWILWIINIKINILNWDNNKILIIKSGNYNKMLILNKKFFLDNLKKINGVLLHTLTISLNAYSLNNKQYNNIVGLFKYFNNKYSSLFSQRYLKKYLLYLHYLYMLNINNFKYDKFTPVIKTLIEKIFNKKVELNLINLKYLHLNNNIFTDAIATRLRKKTSKLFLVLKRSLKLVKLPFMLHKNNLEFANKKFVFNSYKNKELNLLKFNNNSLQGNTDYINLVLYNIFSSKTLNYNILNSINHKWIKGTRLEAKGRLTRRYTASRSVFKYNYKGNLRNTFLHENLVSKMLRGNLKFNVQHTLKKSEKRIGAFGIKSWISTT